MNHVYALRGHWQRLETGGLPVRVSLKWSYSLFLLPLYLYSYSFSFSLSFVRSRQEAPNEARCLTKGGEKGKKGRGERKEER
jgi:hypothetical protein